VHIKSKIESFVPIIPTACGISVIFKLIARTICHFKFIEVHLGALCCFLAGKLVLAIISGSGLADDRRTEPSIGAVKQYFGSVWLSAVERSECYPKIRPFCQSV